MLPSSIHIQVTHIPRPLLALLQVTSRMLRHQPAFQLLLLMLQALTTGYIPQPFILLKATTMLLNQTTIQGNLLLFKSTYFC